MSGMNSYEKAVTNRLKTARGHLEGVIRMVERQAYCPEVMKQLSAVQGLMETTSREVLRHHLETCVAKAMQEGRVEEIVDELMATLKYDKRVLAPRPSEAAPVVGDAPQPNAEGAAEETVR
jgi:DNA-binding FrmR family transcriptional regulator